MGKRSRMGPVDGMVVLWNDEEGWGVVASPSVNGEVWAHFSNIEMTGYRTLTPGQAVRFVYETPPGGMDGYPHCAMHVIPR
jgi:cold shock protein